MLGDRDPVVMAWVHLILLQLSFEEHLMFSLLNDTFDMSLAADFVV